MLPRLIAVAVEDGANDTVRLTLRAWMFTGPQSLPADWGPVILNDAPDRVCWDVSPYLRPGRILVSGLSARTDLKKIVGVVPDPQASKMVLIVSIVLALGRAFGFPPPAFHVHALEKQ